MNGSLNICGGWEELGPGGARVSPASVRIRVYSGYTNFRETENAA